MKDSRIAARGLVLLGCGKMGTAMLQGWLARGLPPASVWVLDPYPSEWLKNTGVNLNQALPDVPAIVLVAVKPQMMAEALPGLKAMGNGTTLFISVAAGVTLGYFESTLGAETPIIRAMPNTPAAISRGITAIVGNAHADAAAMDEADTLLNAVGDVVRLKDETLIDLPENEHPFLSVTMIWYRSDGPAHRSNPRKNNRDHHQTQVPYAFAHLRLWQMQTQDLGH